MRRTECEIWNAARISRVTILVPSGEMESYTLTRRQAKRVGSTFDDRTTITASIMAAGGLEYYPVSIVAGGSFKTYCIDLRGRENV